MTRLAWLTGLTLSLAVMLMLYVGSVRVWLMKERAISRLAVNDRPLNGKEGEWAGNVIWQSDSTVVRVSEEGQFWFQERRGYWVQVGDGIFHPTRKAYPASWGELTVAKTGWFHPLRVTIDGVDEVTEPGRWWRLVRETINRLAAANAKRDAAIRAEEKRKQFVCDSIRLFKLDSTMKAIGR